MPPSWRKRKQGRHPHLLASKKQLAHEGLHRPSLVQHLRLPQEQILPLYWSPPFPRRMYGTSLALDEVWQIRKPRVHVRLAVQPAQRPQLGLLRHLWLLQHAAYPRRLCPNLTCAH